MAWTAAPNHWGALCTSKVVAFSTHKTYGLHKPYLKFARATPRRPSSSPSSASPNAARTPTDRCSAPGRARARYGYAPRPTNHDYADALGRGIPCTLLVTETTGALAPNTVRLLLELAKQAKAPTTHDSTRYGTSKTSPGTYLAHHLAAISSAIVFADATSIMPPAP